MNPPLMRKEGAALKNKSCVFPYAYVMGERISPFMDEAGSKGYGVFYATH